MNDHEKEHNAALRLLGAECAVLLKSDGAFPLSVPGGPGDYKAILKGLKEGTVSRRQLEINATRVYRMAKKLNGKW